MAHKKFHVLYVSVPENSGISDVSGNTENTGGSDISNNSTPITPKMKQRGQTS